MTTGWAEAALRAGFEVLCSQGPIPYETTAPYWPRAYWVARADMKALNTLQQIRRSEGAFDLRHVGGIQRC